MPPTPEKKTAAADSKTPKPAEKKSTPAEPAKAETSAWTPKIGAQVLYTRIHNGPRVVRSLALITGIRSESSLDLLVCPAGAAPFAEAEAPRGVKPGEANTWGPPE